MENLYYNARFPTGTTEDERVRMSFNIKGIEKIKAVVFDCDGVLFDTAQANRMYYNTLLDHFGKPELNDEQFRLVHMFTVKEAIEYLFSEMDSLDSVYLFMKQTGYFGFIKYMEPEEGLIELLDNLKSDGYIRCIATNRTNTMADVLKTHEMEPCFELVVTAADVKAAKPAPDELLRIMEKLHLMADEILFIGDSEYDQRAAYGAGTMFVAFKSPSLDAHFHAKSMADIGRVLALKPYEAN